MAFSPVFWSMILRLLVTFVTLHFTEAFTVYEKPFTVDWSLASTRGQTEDIFAAVHRKEYEMKQVKAQHSSTTDPVRMAMGYAQESVSPMILAKALRRVYEDPSNPANPDHIPPTPEETKRSEKLKDVGMVAEAMVRLGADAVFVNTDYAAYGGDMTELKSAVQAVRAISDSAAVVMKDIVVDEIQLGLAKEAGADGIVLMSSVLGASLENFLNLATMIGLETIVECHTRDEVQRAIDILAPNILVSNNDRITGEHHPEQAIQLAGLFPGSGGPIICLATGGIDSTDKMKRHLAVGYDGVVVGKTVMGSPKAPEFIRAVRDRTLLPAEFSAWGLEDVEFDMDGNVMQGPKKGTPQQGDKDVYQ